MFKPVKNILAWVICLFTVNTQAQSLSKIMDNYLPQLSVTSETDPAFDSIYRITKTSLMGYLEKKLINIEDSSQQYLGITNNADQTFNTYSFVHPSGGTRGSVSSTIVQWKKTDGTYGVYLLHDEFTVFEQYLLPAKDKKLYLLTGTEQASTMKFLGYALVAQVKGDHLILDYPAFFGQTSTLIYADDTRHGGNCLACITYCESCKAIKVRDMDAADDIRITDKKGETQIKVENVKEVSFKFDGKKFVKE